MNVVETEGGLRVGELARVTGLPVATLRTWESRYGFPTPARSAKGGVRRYQPSDARLVMEVLRLRQNGLSMPAAIDAARREHDPKLSFFARLRERWPEFNAQVLSQRALLAISRAIEDEYCARAARAVLFASFQRETAYRRVEARWTELARTAVSTTVFADFPDGQVVHDRVTEIPLGPDEPARREWAVVCDAPGFAVCMTGLELPGDRRASVRRFEVLWSLDGQVVREATRAGISLLARHDSQQAAFVQSLLESTVAVPSDDLRRATSLFSRMMTYNDE